MLLQVDTKWYNLESHLSGQAGPVNWLVGADYLLLNGDLVARRSRTPGFQGNPAALALNSYSTEHWTSKAAYASLEYSFIPKTLSATGEVRFTRDGKDLALDAPVRFFRQNNFSYTGTLNYHPSENILAYFKVGTGYRVGGVNAGQIIPSPPAPIPTPLTYGDENTREFEIGLRGEPSKGATFAFAAYKTRIKGAILSRTNGCTATNACGVTLPAFLDNLGVADIWGVELEGGVNLTIAGGRAVARASVSRQQGELHSGLFVGQAVPQTPKWIGSANVTYTHDITPRTQAIFNANFQGQWGGIQALGLPVFAIDDRTLLNVRLGVRTHGWEVTGYVTNVTNDEFRESTAATSAVWYAGRRTFGIQTRYAW
jgi:iron complex outermembrane receptor protein